MDMLPFAVAKRPYRWDKAFFNLIYFEKERGKRDEKQSGKGSFNGNGLGDGVIVYVSSGGLCYPAGR